MDPLPPNDPNNSNHVGQLRAKEDPHDGRRRRRNGRSNGQDLNDNGEMDALGDLRDQGFVMVMFLMGVASWFLRERCIC